MKGGGVIPDAPPLPSSLLSDATRARSASEKRRDKKYMMVPSKIAVVKTAATKEGEGKDVGTPPPVQSFEGAQGGEGSGADAGPVDGGGEVSQGGMMGMMHSLFRSMTVEEMYAMLGM